MRLEHHLVGGYVRYISPHIIIIIIDLDDLGHHEMISNSLNINCEGIDARVEIDINKT